MCANPTQAGSPSVPLGNGVAGNETEASVAAQQVESAAIKMGDQVRDAVRFHMQGLQPVKIPFAIASKKSVLSRKRRISHDDIKTGIFAVEHLRELNFPVEGRDRELSAAEGLQLVRRALFEVAAQVARDTLGEFDALAFAGLIPVRRKERGHCGIADEADDIEECIGFFSFLALELGRTIVVAQAEEVLPFMQCGGSAFADFLFP